jgi:hypothetical protein
MRIAVMHLRKGTIKTEGCIPLLDAFQLVGIKPQDKTLVHNN